MDPATAIDIDPFDTVLSLEDEYYAEGHALGLADGARAGRIEGRVFGLEKGFEKFVAMGALHAKAAVWAARLPSSTLPPPPAAASTPDQDAEKVAAAAAATTDAAAPSPSTLQLLDDNPRLAKHVTTLHALTEPASLSTQNDEDAVAEFDDRFKRAQAKEKIVERFVGEGREVGELSGADVAAAAAAAAAAASSTAAATTATAAEGGAVVGASGAVESAGGSGTAKGPKRVGVKMVQRKKDGGGEEKSMEDFGAGGLAKGVRS